ncbi:AMP-binding protein [Alcaligenaceae bacterium]|nr:AMP-binding protein [Alcaligenaceae bacterium]
MSVALHKRFWPDDVPHVLPAPAHTLWQRLLISAQRSPSKPALVFYGSKLSYQELVRQAEALAGYLQHEMGVTHGDRVLLLSQNCPQFVVAYYAVQRIGAVAVTLNAMSTTDDASHMATDSGARVVLAAQELLPALQPLLDQGLLQGAVVFAYADMASSLPGISVPEWVMAPRLELARPAGADGAAPIVEWGQAMAAACIPAPDTGQVNDLCLLAYTSGTTGRAKGCMHTHATLQASVNASCAWRRLDENAVVMAVAPLFHLLGMQNGMNLPLMLGGTAVMMARWDRVAAWHLIRHYRVTVWAAPPTMVVDFFSNPDVTPQSIASLSLLSGGGAAMPEAVASRLANDYGIIFNEGYGMTETASFLHCNPLNRPKRQCLGCPTTGVDSRIIDPDTGRELAQGEVGEIVTHAPQVTIGYWNNPQADQEAFIQIDGKRFLRTGDLAHVDADGYFFMRDRLKRMVNVSGYKVWPAEIENLLYEHPAVQEACVIAACTLGDKGEQVKAVIVLRPASQGQVDAQQIIDWARGRMAVYKAPRVVEFVEQLPKSNTGKILWRKLQEIERSTDSVPTGAQI